MDFFIENALAQGAPAAQPSAFGMLLPMLILFVAFYFLLIRPQQKRQKAHQKMVADLGTGDEIITAGGIVGKVMSISEQFVIVSIADGVEVKVQRQTISAVLPKGTVDAA
ncbi:MAG: preprotein translocase subunit YajC [Pseudomonadota bacterium]